MEMKVNAVFQSQQISLEETPCRIEKVISLPDREYHFFKKHLMHEYGFLRENRDRMGFRDGVRQCLLVMGESSEDGLLVDSGGHAFARCVAPFLGARSYLTVQHQTLSEKAGPERSLTPEEVTLIQAKHTLWCHDAGGEQANFSHCRLMDMSLRGMQFNGGNFRGAVLENVNFRDAGVCHGDFSGARLVKCRLDGIAAEECDFRGAVFENCTLTDARMAHSDFTGASLYNCAVWNADLRNCCVENLSSEGTALEDAYTQNICHTWQEWKSRSEPVMGDLR